MENDAPKYNPGSSIHYDGKVIARFYSYESYELSPQMTIKEGWNYIVKYQAGHVVFFSEKIIGEMLLQYMEVQLEELYATWLTCGDSRCHFMGKMIYDIQESLKEALVNQEGV